MPEINRRQFLKLGAGLGLRAGVAVATGEALIPAGLEINKITEDLTHQKTGNAYIREKFKDRCVDPDCTQLFLTSQEKAEAVLQAPITEEFLFRAFPSFVLSISEKNDWPEIEMIRGTQDLSFSRREFFTGVLSSLIFGYFHNLTESGVDVQTIPAAQILMGEALWYLQRKFGYFTNTLTHMWISGRIVSTSSK
jgi:hypothetical protein